MRERRKLISPLPWGGCQISSSAAPFRNTPQYHELLIVFEKNSFLLNNCFIVFKKVHNFSIPSWVTDDVWIRIQNVVNREKELKYGDQESNYLEAGGGN